jgi:hypothetical protein
MLLNLPRSRTERQLARLTLLIAANLALTAMVAVLAFAR